jgi:hypothetical protein
MRIHLKSALRLFLVTFLLLEGCSPTTMRSARSEPGRPAECEELFSRLDGVLWDANVRDASASKVPGFPYLRSNRFLAALGSRVKTEAEKRQWLDLLRRLDLEVRQKEIRNLTDADLGKVASPSGETDGRRQVLQRMSACSEQLSTHDGSDPRLFEQVRSRAEVPDEYSSLMRFTGLHPLASLPVVWVTDRVRSRVKNWFDGGMEKLPVRGELQRFAPQATRALGPEGVEAIIRNASDNPLSIPLPSPDDASKLLELFAPELTLDIAASYDRFGAVAATPVGPHVDSNDPTVYTYLSHAFLHGKPVLQCNYAVWFPERAGSGAPRIERGRLDGLTIRVSLDTKGKPFMVDIMNNCGCYHFFVPDRMRVALVRSRPAALDPFVPQWLPDFYPENRLAIRVNSGWHQVQRVFGARNTDTAVLYRLTPYAHLESQPGISGQWVSLFDSRGIVEGSQRIEPLIFFPMGIHSIGSMRQRGHHAIDLIGREHFDNPELFNRSFIFR